MPGFPFDCPDFFLSPFQSRFTEQNALKHSYQEADRSELRALSRGKMWSSLTNGDVCRGEQKSSRVPPRGDTGNMNGRYCLFFSFIKYLSRTPSEYLYFFPSPVSESYYF